MTFQLTCGGISKAAAEAKAAAQAKAPAPASAPAASNEAEDYALMGARGEHPEDSTEAQQRCNRDATDLQQRCNRGATDLEDLASIVSLARRQWENDGIATDEEGLGEGGGARGVVGDVGIAAGCPHESNGDGYADVHEEEIIVFRPRAKSTDGVHTGMRICEEVNCAGSATQRDPSHAAAGVPSTKVLAY